MYEIDRNLDIPLYIQIRKSIEKSIENGELKPGDKLPSVSSLAKTIGVTQATIRRALQDLVEAGHTKCQVGRGTFIRDTSVPGADQKSFQNSGDSASAGRQQGERRKKPHERAATRLRTGVSKALYDIMPLAHKQGVIAFTKGVPDEKMIPEGFMGEVLEEVVRGNPSSLAAASDPAGMFELRREIARRASEDGLPVTPEMVLITNGGVSQVISLVSQHALENYPEIVCETPCYQGVPNAFSAMGHWVETVPRDEHGPILEQLERFNSSDPRFFYICPFVHNPMGTHLSTERYAGVVDWARRTGSVVIADEIFKELDFEGNTPPSLLKDLGGEQTIVASSISKSIMPGLRIGWMISSQRRIQEFTQLKRLMDHSTPTITQAMALAIFTSGKFEEHTSNMRLLYKSRMTTLLSSLKRLMPREVRWSKPEGGFSILLELPKGYSSVALLLSAIDKGVSFLPGPLFDIDHRYVHGLRLSIASVDENQIKEGVELLAKAIEDFLAMKPGDTGLSGLGSFQ